MKRCKKCGAAIFWATTPKGKKIPIDDGHAERGNVSIEVDLLGDPVAVIGAPGSGPHVSHFATCPYASEFRRKT